MGLNEGSWTNTSLLYSNWLGSWFSKFSRLLKASLFTTLLKESGFFFFLLLPALSNVEVDPRNMGPSISSAYTPLSLKNKARVALESIILEW